MNILYIFGGEKASGAEIVIERLLAFNKQHKSHLLLAPGSFATRLINDDKAYEIHTDDNLKKLNRSSASVLQFYFRAFSNYILLSMKVARYIRKYKIDVVHANTVVPASYLLPLVLWNYLKFSNVKWVWSDHDLQYYSGLDTLLSKLCVKLYHRTLVVSEAVKKKYVSSKKIVVLYNGLDTKQYRDIPIDRIEYRTDLEINDEIIIGLPAMISPRKGHVPFIKVFNELQKIYNIRLLLAGKFAEDDPSYSEKVQELISSSSKIVYLGEVTNTVKFYNACDIIINNTSLSGGEPLGTTIYEAMACEKIILASNTGGTQEIINDRVNGFIFNPDDYASLYDTLEFVLKNIDNLGNVRKMARLKVLNRFNIEVMCETYLSLLHKI